jgi:hypothetical protein
MDLLSSSVKKGETAVLLDPVGRATPELCGKFQNRESGISYFVDVGFLGGIVGRYQPFGGTYCLRLRAEVSSHLTYLSFTFIRE